MSEVTYPIRIASISDIHLGHRRNKTKNIIDNLNKYLSNVKFMCSIDLLFLAGDVFDRLLDLPGDDVSLIMHWIARLLSLAIRNNVCVRVLEGTPSHDRGQSENFVTINEIIKKNTGVGADLEYINTLRIDNIARFNLNVLYIPDEWGATADDTLDQVRYHMRQKGLEQVDIAVMHGLFPHQLDADIQHISRHDDVAYSALVKYFITIGHIHTFSQHNNITAQGSFDRNGHNEEEAKGFIKARINKDGTYDITFIENKTAATFKTINCFSEDVTESLLQIDQEVKDLRPGSYCRISADYWNPILSNMAVLKERWPLFNWSDVKRGKEKKETKATIDYKNVYIPIVLDRINLPNQLLNRVVKLDIPDDVKDLCAVLMAEVEEIM